MSGELESRFDGYDVTGSDVTAQEAGSRRLDLATAMVVRARAALNSFQYKSSEELEQIYHTVTHHHHYRLSHH